jgi:predicted RNase H-like nuclease (RuvC/YqgF family)
VGGLWLSSHPLQNEEEAKFEEMRPLLKQWAALSAHPALPELSRQLAYLQRVRDADADAEQEVDRKIEVVSRRLAEERLKLETLMKGIVHLNNELKDIRKRTGMETVPWKIHVKEFEIDGRPAYDLGVTAF